MLHVVFFSPRIAGNTGNAIRMVSGTGAALHLVEPLGFDLAEAKLRRAGVGRVFAFTTQATRPYTGIDYLDGDALLFGPEPTGLPADVLAHPQVLDQVRIPMLPGRRSMNLSNAAAVATYEAWRQLGFPGGV